MGYWDTNERGDSFCFSDSGEKLVWGEKPSWLMFEAIERIKMQFLLDLGRLPTVAEIRAGFEFMFVDLDNDLPQVPSMAKEVTAQQAEVIRQWSASTLNPLSPLAEEAWRHIKAVFEDHKPEQVIVPDNLADLTDGPF